jgi:adenylate kinase
MKSHVKKSLQVVLFGPQGCGKGTQGQLLAERFNIPFVSSGDMFRDEIEEKTHLGILIEEYVIRGLLAPDEVVNAIVARRLQALELSQGFILDGYPRNVEQAIHLDRLMKINLAIYVKISDQESVRRLAGRVQCPVCKQIYHVTDAPPLKPGKCSVCGSRLVRREDDTEELIRHRLVTYHFMTEPLTAYYRERGVLLTVNGEQPIVYVFQDIVKRMAKLGFKI